jgi:hypothetical protein
LGQRFALGSGKGAVDENQAAGKFAAEADLAIGEGGYIEFDWEHWR